MKTLSNLQLGPLLDLTHLKCNSPSQKHPKLSFYTKHVDVA